MPYNGIKPPQIQGVCVIPFNGSGSFTVSGAPFAAGTTIAAGAMNPKLTDLAGGLTNAITRDGQSPATANIPMGSYKITGLGNATAATDAAAYGQLGWVRIQQQVLAAPASVIDFALPTGFSVFQLVGSTLFSASANLQLAFRISTNSGVSYDAGATDYGTSYSFQSSSLNAGSATTSSILVTEQGAANVPQFFNAMIHPGDGAFGLRAFGTSSGINSGGGAFSIGTFTGARAATGRATNIRVLPSVTLGVGGAVTLLGMV